MSTLALDLATVTGWALQSEGGLCSGVVRLNAGRGRPHRTRWNNLWWWLDSMLQIHDIDAVVSEQPFVFPGRPQGARVPFALAACVEAWCEHKGISWSEVPPKVVKKHATGKGNADKVAMVQAAMDRWPGQDAIDHNQADALWILDWASK